MAQTISKQEELVQDTNTQASTTDTSKANKVDLSAKSSKHETDVFHGYCSGKHAAKFLSEKVGKEVPVTTVNNLAYADKIDYIKIAGVFLFKLEGEKSLSTYAPTMIDKINGVSHKKQENLISEATKKWGKMFVEMVNKAIADNNDTLYEQVTKANMRIRKMLKNKEVPDINAILTEEGVSVK